MNLLDDVKNNGPFMLSTYGAHYALGFKGTPDFIHRCFNWAVNTGVVGKGGQLMWYYEAETGRLAYVCPKSLKAIKNGLYLQFQAEIIMNREIAPLEDRSRDDEWIEKHHVEESFDGTPTSKYDDWKIARLAARRVKEFMKDHIIKDSYFLHRPESLGNIYGLAHKGRADDWSEV